MTPIWVATLVYTSTVDRREFLLRCGWGAAAALRPGSAPAVPGDFHLHPHYREQTPLDPLLSIRADLDRFPAEILHDQIAPILAGWNSDLLRSPRDTGAIRQALAPSLQGASPRPVGVKVLRAGAALEVQRLHFSSEITLGPDAFIRQFSSALADFSSLITAEFQITSIAVLASGSVQTQVRYELVGAGGDFYREQRSGVWDLVWDSAPSGTYQVRTWRWLDETRSRSAVSWFQDITQHAFGTNGSYSEQLLHGVDYWRTVLDGACGIDIYGHNGVSVGDIDNDGLDDLYVCQPAGLPNRLYRNRGDGTFEDVTEHSGLGLLDNTACALFADFDNDGRQDAVVVRAGGPLLFLNEGGGKFHLKPNAFRFANPPQGTFTGAAAADYNRDGFLDVYFCLYAYYQGADQYRYPVPYEDAENGPPNFLMRNNGEGTFSDVTSESGLNRNNTRYSFCCGWGDVNGNGGPDLYVVNDFGRKNLHSNNGDGTFTDIAPQAAVEDVGAGMSVSWLDYDNDGAQDLYVADMWTAAGQRISQQESFHREASQQVRALYRKHAMGNSLFRNKGDSTFRDMTIHAGVGMGRWSWSSDAWDFDHDGFHDLYVVNGMVSGPSREDLNSFFWREVVAKSPNQVKNSPDYEQAWNAVNELLRSDYTWSGYERNNFFVNHGDGTFSDVSGALGLDFIEDGRSFVLADFNGDGRQEVLAKNRNGPPLRLLRSVQPNLPSAIAFRLRGTKSNRDAIGAAVTIETPAGRQTRVLQAGSGFLSQHSKELFFGLGASKGPVKATVRWPNGLVQQWEGLPAGHRISLEEGVDAYGAEPFKAVAASIDSTPASSERLPEIVETWLISPVAAPHFTSEGRPALVHFWTSASSACREQMSAFNQVQPQWAAQGWDIISLDCDKAADDVTGVYNLLYRYLFDRHRDLPLPASFLVDGKGDIVKIYQGPIAPAGIQEDFQRLSQGANAGNRLSRALPFRGVDTTYEFGRNYLSLGSVFFGRGYYDQAESSFARALRENPSSAEALYGLGSVYLKQNKISEARDRFEKAVKCQGSYPDTLPNAWNNLGLIAARENQTDEAIGYFLRALALIPDHFVSLENLGNAYRQEKRWDDAHEAFEHALTVKPQDPEANYGLAMVFAQTGDTQRAYDLFQRALQYRPVYPEALNNLGVLYLRTQRRDQAVQTFEKCIRIAPDFDRSYLNLARVYAVEGDVEKAREVLLHLLGRLPGNDQARQALKELK
ncbi:MAG TPA: FG-GAP-like repeat-containing protein [Bryobacteraceae bacterium]|nr:FG-GAP-like repeat-containing protein [Bryobacteraceae bacterium]